MITRSGDGDSKFSLKILDFEGLFLKKSRGFEIDWHE